MSIAALVGYFQINIFGVVFCGREVPKDRKVLAVS